MSELFVLHHTCKLCSKQHVGHYLIRSNDVISESRLFYHNALFSNAIKYCLILVVQPDLEDHGLCNCGLDLSLET